MANYYYLISSLPMLHMGHPAPISVEAFLGLCEGQLDPDELLRLTDVTLLPRDSACCQLERRWQAFETFVRHLLVRHRAGKREVRQDQWLREEIDVFPGIMHRIEDALSSRGPLARERALDEIRWHAIDDFLTGHHFDFDAVVGYFLKLQIGAKWAAFDADAGLERYESLISDSLDQAGGRREVHEE